jgi:hypothetical protein
LLFATALILLVCSSGGRSRSFFTRSAAPSPPAKPSPFPRPRLPRPFWWLSLVQHSVGRLQTAQDAASNRRKLCSRRRACGESSCVAFPPLLPQNPLTLPTAAFIRCLRPFAKLLTYLHTIVRKLRPTASPPPSLFLSLYLIFFRQLAVPRPSRFPAPAFEVKAFLPGIQTCLCQYKSIGRSEAAKAVCIRLFTFFLRLFLPLSPFTRHSDDHQVVRLC